ncbi:hypothetical protein WR25_05330 isoform B [Diploscapter pachys]|uniref:receptor protein-tyrosine kinase n=1 Tax=Diploscapter pachys TaxID=2018661 RepID=A0A2A2M0Z7_9BILA|nr:hypothetical protein WR25_05330 isoform A [Diploscapter pachys]PAV92165.1 hypothetical protein WR25_05330 isoform B [Diploscapter pachys]
MQFQNNRMLCFHQIQQLFDKMDRRHEMSEEDQSPNSNGDKAICEDSTFNVTVDFALSNSFTLSWDPIDTASMDHRKFLGYEVFYKEVPFADPNMTRDDDRSACSDSWNSQFHEVKISDDTETFATEEEQNVTTKSREREVVTVANENIKPYTTYAFYVQTQIVRHEGARNSVSQIGFVTTNFSTPDPPRIKDVEIEIDSNKIKLVWEKPIRPNGVVTHYVVSWRAIHPNLEAQSKTICDSHNPSSHRHGASALSSDPLASPQSATTTTSSPNPAGSGESLVSMITPTPANTCAAKGCCECSANSLANKKSNVEKNAEFENTIQNYVFVQNCDVNFDPERCASYQPHEEAVNEARSKREVEAGEERRIEMNRAKHTIRHSLDDWEGIDYESAEIKKRSKRAIRDALENKEKESTQIDNQTEKGKEEEKGTTQSKFVKEAEKSVANVEKHQMMMESPMRKNVTDTFILLDTLKHHTDYSISVSACQDVKVHENSCSPPMKAQRIIKTKSLIHADEVDASTINVQTLNRSTSSIQITWKKPLQPNGGVLGYRIIFNNTAIDAIPHSVCQSASESNWTSDKKGVIVKGLADGEYKVSLQTISLAGVSLPSEYSRTVAVYSPRFWTFWRIIFALLAILILLAAFGLIAFYAIRRYYGGKVKEYATQLISANPEYLSQNEVYKADEWELKRSDLILEDEIGHGTFGKVYRGQTVANVTSISGISFGECAIKTVAESAGPAERIHFLLEANVMKQFNSSFIIKLLGVVSDGQPVLVVMEMMSKGNLRDYLRSRRPGAEENKDNSPVPTKEQYHEWAAQIADGMAYLESIRFVHRDLAARNCMVNENLTVKIGDFGMARDLYYHEYYKPTGKRLMPVRWMAPESLKDGKFDSKSDVWSYGVVLYEMLTLGQQPYQGLGNDEVLSYIGVSRKIMDKPMDCPDYWYELMKQCWQYSPAKRPTFSQIVQHIAKDASEEFRQASYISLKSYILNRPESDSEPTYVMEPHQNQSISNNVPPYLLPMQMDDSMGMEMCGNTRTPQPDSLSRHSSHAETDPLAPEDNEDEHSF